MVKETVYTLSIDKIDEEHAVLREIKGSKMSYEGIFKDLGKYKSRKCHLHTPDEVKVYTGFDSDDKEYKITRIQDCAFSNCKDLINLVIGPYVKEIRWNMYRCDSLMNIRVDKNNTIYHDIDGVLFFNDELVAFPQGRTGHYNVPNGTKKIGRMAFKSCHLSSIYFPNTLEEIGINSFYECYNIREFVLPKSIKRVNSNYNVGYEPITQDFYLFDDKEKKNPLKISDIILMFPA